MGCDGGTIPKRCELVKEKKKREQKDKDVELMARWLLCALSQIQLRFPIVACELGRLYNKESILEFLLDRSKFESGENFSHIRSLKDVHVLRLTPNPASTTNDQSSSSASSATLSSMFICPISQCEVNGKHKFLYPVTCGCVFSERAFRELLPQKTNGKSSEETAAETATSDDSYKIPCPVCGVSFNYVNDIVVLHPEPGPELDEAKKNMERRRLLQKSSKKSSKESSNGGGSSSTTMKRSLDNSEKVAKSAPAEEPKKSKIVSGSSKVLSATSTTTKPEEKSAVYRSLFTSSQDKPKGKTSS